MGRSDLPRFNLVTSMGVRRSVRLATAKVHQPHDTAERDVPACDSSRKRKFDQLNLQTNSASPQDNAPEELCSKCQQIDFEAAFQIPDNIRRETHGVVVAELGRKGIEWGTTTCPMCRLFAAVRGPSDESSVADTSHYHLRAFSFLEASGTVFTNRRLPKPLKKADSPCLLVLGGKGRSRRPSHGQYSSRPLIDFKQFPGIIYPVVSSAIKPSSQLGTRRLLPDRIDYHLLRNWYGFCAQNHRKTCATESQDYPEMLRVIDCRTRKTIEAPPSCAYVALSYVWGQQQLTKVSSSVSFGKNTGHRTLSSLTIPRVISDAIMVTLELGWQYLWVDRYCIDQNDEEKHFQINQMDKVYLCAVITIIAAAGESANHGLPGVSNILRRAQPCAVVRGQLLACTMRRAREAIGSSRWATRGWTYQEAALSVRRLVFTEEQIFFECKCMSCSESCSVPLALLHEKNLEHGCRSCIQRGYFETYDDGRISPLTTTEKYWQQVRQFTARELSYETDSLNAFMGVANYYKNGQGSRSSPIHSHIGLPLDFEICSNGEQHAFYGRQFVLNLLWEHSRRQEGFQAPVLPKRRQGFPSFSWVGWEGATLGPFGPFLLSFKPMARILRDPGTNPELSTQLGTTLDLEADTVQGQIEISEKPNSIGLHTTFCLTNWENHREDGVILPRDFLSRHKLSSGQIFVIDCIWIGTLGDIPGFFLMLIEYHGPIAERVGVTRVFLSKEEFQTLPKTRRRIRLG